ncbi:MAG: response regulator [gamma proteobacterium symbiont of Bathyaustriella thionipta]|nr:response regulator [gamma proteobacterium symbiont of Bathyaustriella thionipta]MCU7951519.1 response regulator [gamma proteobacterium symbiont of Bathyaustriella thionipta]MCU7958092.1 response regulator [gamma proteobacterium symbiont of Bathyaustriella thionipta]MCU7967826.1 response regulator [gamma proteobacterium symbiont of Bathyaustriella thionipta]
MIDKKQLREKVRHLKLLYVEDEVPLREQGEIFLKKFFNVVETASNGEEGLNVFTSNTFDIIISDIKMPKMYGDKMLFEMLKKAEKNQHNLFTVILTATLEERDVDANFDLFMLKPIEFEQMFELLQHIERKFKL